MSWVIARGGTILYKAMWTSAARIADFVERPGAGRDRRQSTFYSEQLEARDLDRADFYRGLERNGPRAVAEFARAEQIWAERERSGG
jgi:hypothetical protein